MTCPLGDQKKPRITPFHPSAAIRAKIILFISARAVKGPTAPCLRIKQELIEIIDSCRLPSTDWHSNPLVTILNLTQRIP